MHLLRKVGIATAALAVAATSMALMSSPASADSGARPGDVVGVGSDTLQNAADFIFDGGNGFASGYNSLNNVNRVFNVDATGDANGRATYDGSCGSASSTTGLAPFCDSTTLKAPNLLPGSVVLRDGQKPVTRPNGSGAGAAALIADAPGGAGYDGLPLGSIQFARMSRLPNSTEETNCSTTGPCGGLHVYQAATDNLAIAHVKTGYDGPSGGLSAQELVSIYTCQTTTWNALPGNSGGSTATIHPLIPQSGSGTRNFFLADLQTQTGSTTAIQPGTCVRTVEEHDPTGIYGDPSPADAIEPFSTGKIALINSGYFSKGAGYSGTAEANGAYTPNYLTTDAPNQTATDGHTNYYSTRGLYFAIRNSDLGSTTPFQAGSAENFAQALFASSSSYIARSANAAAFTDAGFTQNWKDCGINPTSC